MVQRLGVLACKSTLKGNATGKPPAPHEGKGGKDGKSKNKGGKGKNSQTTTLALFPTSRVSSIAQDEDDRSMTMPCLPAVHRQYIWCAQGGIP